MQDTDKHPTWRFDHDSGKNFTKIEIEEMMIKWTHDIIENPDVHFKAEDQRRFSEFSEDYQSFLNFIVKPMFPDIPKELHAEISQYIRDNFSVEDLEASYRNRLGKAFHYWTPTQEKLVYSTSSREGAEEYYDVGKGILHIYHEFIDPFDRHRVQKLIPFEDIVGSQDSYPDKVVQAAIGATVPK